LELILKKLLQWPAFELNITCLWLLKILGNSDQNIKNFIKTYIPKPVGEPIKVILNYMSQKDHKSETIDIASSDEPDKVVANY